MSWFNTSLNSIKGQITTFAQEVLTENAGDDEEQPNVAELLEETQRKNEELGNLCAAKDTEIASLRKQVSDLLAKNPENFGRSSKSASAIDKNASLEDSWCWEPDNVPSDSSGKRDHERTSESSSGGGELIAIPLDTHASHDNETIEKYQRFLDDRDARLKQLTSENAALYEKISRLTDENVELQSNLEELDNQHNVAIKEVLDLKNDWQTKWNLLNGQHKAAVQEHELKTGSAQKDYETLQKKFESIQTAYTLYIQENEVLKLELEQAKGDVQLLEDERIESKRLEETITQLKGQLIELETQKVELENKSSPEPGKRDEDGFIVLQNEDSYEQKYNALVSEKQKIEQELESLTKELDYIKTDRDTTKADLESKILVLTKDLKDMKHQQSLSEIELYEKQLSDLTETLKKCESNNVDLETKLKTENINLQKQIIDLESFINKSNVKTNNNEPSHPDNTTNCPLNYDDLNQLFASYAKLDSATVVDKSSLETAFKSIADKIWKVDILEKNLKEMSDDVLRLKTEKETIDHERTTLQADIGHYEVECAELMKNNEILLNELENYKRNKLETIPENNEEGIVMMERQLEESNSYLRNLEEQYNETVEKLMQADEKRYELEDMIEGLQESNTKLSGELKALKDQIESLENEKSNLVFEINEMETDDKKSAVEIVEYKSQMERLQRDHEQLSKLHNDLKTGNDTTNNLQHRIESLMSEKAALENKVQVLESQFEHYELKCSHLKDDNEMLRKELEEVLIKSVAQNPLDNVDELKRQLVETQSTAKCVEDRFDEISQRVVELEVQNNELRAELTGQRDNNTNLMSELVTLKSQTETLESERNRLVLEINELRTDDNKCEAMMKTKRLEYEANVTSLESQLAQLSKDHADLVAALQAQKSNFSENRKKAEEQISLLEKQLKDKNIEMRNFEETIRESHELIEKQKLEITGLEVKFQGQQNALTDSDQNTSVEVDQLMQQLESLTHEKANLITTITTKHNENTQYYMEIQRLSQLLQVELEKSQKASTAPCEKCRQLQTTCEQNEATTKSEMEKLQDQINFLKEKSDILTTNLISEQSTQKLLNQEKSELLEKNALLQRDLERLREHLVEMEEAHTQETLELHNSMEDTKSKMLTLQDQVSNSSNAYTSASIRASQHAETLQAQYLLVCQQRDEYVAKLSAAEDKESKNQAALVNLQCALEQFQKEKETDIHSATLRLQKELQNEREKQNELNAEIKSFQAKLADANQGLLAAARLSDQLENSQVTIASLKEEITKHLEKITTLEDKLKSTQESQADKVEKNLVKSLLIGYIVSLNQNDKNQILRLITTVLDFNDVENDRVGLNKSQGGWLTGLLHGGQTGGDHSKDSLTQAFVNFLEKESQPRPSAANMPNLLQMTSQDHKYSSNAGAMHQQQSARKLSQQSNSSQSGGIQPILLNESVLEQYAPTRNSSSILKDILSDS